MKTYRVNIQVIKVYEIDVIADSDDEAIEIAMQSQSSEIQKYGKLISTETAYAEIMGQN